MRRLTYVCAAAVAMLLLAPAPATAANGKAGVTSSPAPTSVLAVMRAQIPLDAAASRIEAAAGPSSGLAGISVDPARGGLNVFWHGALPASAQRALARERAAGIAIDVAPAAFSRQELQQEARRLVAATMGAAQSDSGVTVRLIGPRVDGSGIDVAVAAPAPLGRAGIMSALPALQSSVPTNLVAAPAFDLQTREADIAPFWGGAEITTATGTACTAGFAVNRAGSQYLLTASHCSASGVAWRTGAGSPIANSGFRTTAHDNMLIGPTSSQGRIYDGPAIGFSGQFSNPVISAVATHVGDFICTSGAFSGTVCNIRAVATGLSINISGFGVVSGIVQMESQNHSIGASGNGDSGGPVIAVGSDTTQVIARGTITAGDGNTNTTCSGVPAGGGRTCSWRAFYPDITIELPDSGSTIMTGA